jgi:hypothetical protein
MNQDPKDQTEQEMHLIERLASAHRSPHPTQVPEHPVLMDMTPQARERGFHYITALRTLEAALDPNGLSTTAHAVLRRLTQRG